MKIRYAVLDLSRGWKEVWTDMTNVLLGAEVDPNVVGSEACTILGSSLRKRIDNYEHKIRYEIEYLIRVPSRALEETRASAGPSS